MDGAGVVILVVFIPIIVAVIAYRAGYLWAQVEFLDPSHRLEAKWRILPMEAPLPRWRRGAGWVAYVLSALLLSALESIRLSAARGTMIRFSLTLMWGICPFLMAS